MNKKPKLGIIYSSPISYSYGGIAPFMKNLDVGLSEAFEVHYFTLPAWLHNINIIPRRLIYLFWLFVKASSMHSMDFLLSHTPEGSYFASFLGVKYAHIFHGNFNPMSQSRFWYGKYFARMFQLMEVRIIRTSSLMYTVGNVRDGVPKILNPILHDVQPKAVCDRKGFIFAGRLELIKNVDRLIGIYAKLPDSLRAQHPFYIAGEGTQKETLVKLAVDLGIGHQVQFLGGLANLELIAWESSMKLLLMASSQEGLPMAIAEALSVGVPVISTDVGDISRAVLPGENGYLVPLSFSDEEYIGKLLAILDSYETFSRRALASSVIFDASVISKSLCSDIFQEMIGAKPSMNQGES